MKISPAITRKESNMVLIVFIVILMALIALWVAMDRANSGKSRDNHRATWED
jgi:hypothetical protein